MYHYLFSYLLTEGHMADFLFLLIINKAAIKKYIEEFEWCVCVCVFVPLNV